MVPTIFFCVGCGVVPGDSLHGGSRGAQRLVPESASKPLWVLGFYSEPSTHTVLPGIAAAVFLPVTLQVSVVLIKSKATFG